MRGSSACRPAMGSCVAAGVRGASPPASPAPASGSETSALVGNLAHAQRSLAMALFQRLHGVGPESRLVITDQVETAP